jgi:Flp pilus assembly protein TadG
MQTAEHLPATTDTRTSRRVNPLRSKRGQSFVETGIAIIVLLGFVFSVMDAAMLFWTYITLENGVTEATRFAVTNQTLASPGNPNTQLSREDSIKLAMRTESPGITIADGEFGFFDVTTNSAGTGSPNDVIRVTITHPYNPIFPILFLANPNRQFTITVSSTMMNEPPPFI